MTEIRGALGILINRGVPASGPIVDVVDTLEEWALEAHVGADEAAEWAADMALKVVAWAA